MHELQATISGHVYTWIWNPATAYWVASIDGEPHTKWDDRSFHGVVDRIDRLIYEAE